MRKAYVDSIECMQQMQNYSNMSRLAKVRSNLVCVSKWLDRIRKFANSCTEFFQRAILALFLMSLIHSYLEKYVRIWFVAVHKWLDRIRKFANSSTGFFQRSILALFLMSLIHFRTIFLVTYFIVASQRRKKQKIEENLLTS